ncbi:MAG: arylsulfatase A [Planctomycetota bacterium]|jgi:arylsulfatase A
MYCSRDPHVGDEFVVGRNQQSEMHEMLSVKSWIGFVLLIGLMCLSVFIAGCSSSVSHGSNPGNSKQRYPNIVYILADDLGVGDIKALNVDGQISTPNIDELARRGMVFTDAHSGSAVCTPTRYGVLTGRYSWRTRLQTGVLESYSKPLIAPERETVASLLKKHDYATACIGKWHLGWDWPTTDGEPVITSGINEGGNVDYSRPITNGPRALGFDYFFGIPASLDMVPYVYVENERVIAAPTEKVSVGKRQAFHRSGPAAPGFKHEEVLPTCTSKAVDYLDSQGRSANHKPFFLYFPLSAPHAPIVPASRFQGATKLGAYGDFVHQVDWSVGEVMKALKRNGLDENTLVIFTADNGCAPGANFKELAAQGHHPSFQYRGLKADIFEGGHRVPFIASWPGQIEEGSSANSTTCLTDLFATVAEIVDAEVPEDAAEDSFSLLAEFRSQKRDKPRGAVIHHSSNGSFAVRSGRWKLILCPGSGGHSYPRTQKAMMLGLPLVQLYDLHRDVAEKVNEAARYPEVVEQLTKLLEDYVKRGRSTAGSSTTNDETPDIHRAAKLSATDYKLVAVVHDAKGRAIESRGISEPQYARVGLNALVDGVRATTWYADGYWAGFLGDNMDVVVDLGASRTIESVRVGFLGAQSFWIFHPTGVKLSVSQNGRDYSEYGDLDFGAPLAQSANKVKDAVFALKKTRARWIRIQAQNVGICPPWHKGKGGKAWVFADEIVVN